jgi:uncharacterized protein YcbK (DUF882 family)
MAKLIDRRTFLWQTGLAACAVPAMARAFADDSRSLSFVHTHTGEQLSAVYFANGAYVPDSLQRINELLRDFRSEEVHPIEPALLDLVHQLWTTAGQAQPLQVISGYRSPTTNQMLHSRSTGVAEHSLHMLGQAIDIRLPGCATTELCTLARRMGRGGVGYYRVSDFVHVDVGRPRIWGDPL